MKKLILIIGISLLASGCNFSQQAPLPTKEKTATIQTSPFLREHHPIWNLEDLLEKAHELDSVTQLSDFPNAFKRFYHNKEKADLTAEFSKDESVSKAWDPEKWVVYRMKQSLATDSYELIAYDENYKLEKNGEEIRSFPRKRNYKEPLKNFIVNDSGRWILLVDEVWYNDEELENIVQETGEMPETPRKEASILIHKGEVKRVEEAFALLNIEGKTFYFFRETADSPLHYYYDEENYPTSFETIIHDRSFSDPDEKFDLFFGNESKSLIFRDSKKGEASINRMYVSE